MRPAAEASCAGARHETALPELVRHDFRGARVYELLDQVNLCGTAGSPAEVLGEMSEG